MSGSITITLTFQSSNLGGRIRQSLASISCSLCFLLTHIALKLIFTVKQVIIDSKCATFLSIDQNDLPCRQHSNGKMSVPSLFSQAICDPLIECRSFWLNFDTLKISSFVDKQLYTMSLKNLDSLLLLNSPLVFYVTCQSKASPFCY